MTWQRSCEHEAGVRDMVRHERAEPALLDHADRCDVCRDVLAVTRWMRAFSAMTSSGSALPDPSRLWWKAELLRRWDADQRAAAPIEIGERVQVALGLAGGVAMLVWIWRDAAQLASLASGENPWVGPGLVPAIALSIVVSGVLLAGIGVLTVRDFFERERV